MNYRIEKTLIVALVSSVISACGGGGSGPAGAIPPIASAQTKTLTFQNSNFTELEIGNSFAFIVQYGDRFAIEVTVDEQYSDMVLVSQNGVRLSVGFNPDFRGDIHAQTAFGIVTLPVLDVIESSGSALVDMAGFTQSYIQFAQTGSSHIEAANCQFDLISATLDGSSHLSLQHISPLPAANVDLAGSSQVILSMMNGGTLTGSAIGSSHVGYYGNNITQQVRSVNSAAVTWLGNTVN